MGGVNLGENVHTRTHNCGDDGFGGGCHDEIFLRPYVWALRSVFPVFF